MHSAVLKLFRLFAFTAALGAVLIVALGHATLPSEIPVTRWAAAPKTFWLVVRVPLINLLSLGLVVLLERSLVRAHAGSAHRDNAMMALTALFATLGVKAFLEAFELLMLPTVFAWLPWALTLWVAGGLVVAALTGLPLLRKTTAPRLFFTTGEKLVAILSVAGILGLQIFPAVSR